MELTDLIGELERGQAADGLIGISPSETLAHPAWTLPMEWNGEKAELRSDGIVPADAIAVRVRFGATPCVLALAASEAFPELSRLLPVRSAVPEAILLAEIEKEAGPLLAVLEDATRMEVAVDGLCEAAADATAFLYKDISQCAAQYDADYGKEERPNYKPEIKLKITLTDGKSDIELEVIEDKGTRDERKATAVFTVSGVRKVIPKANETRPVVTFYGV